MSFRTGEREESSYIHQLQKVHLPGVICTRCHLERKGPLTTQGSPVKYDESNPWAPGGQFICLLRFQPPTVEDTKKGVQKSRRGTTLPIRQLREQHCRVMT